MKVTNVTTDTLGYTGFVVEPGATVEVPNEVGKQMLAKNPKKFQQAEKEVYATLPRPGLDIDGKPINLNLTGS